MTKAKRKGLSIRTKMFLEISAIFLIAVLLILFINTNYVDDIYLYNEQQKLKSVAASLDKIDISSGSYFGTLNYLESENNISIDVFDTDGEPIYLSTKNVSGNGVTISVLETKSQSDGSVIEIYDIDGRQYMVLKKQLSYGGELEIYSYKGNIDVNADIAMTLTWSSLIIILTLSVIFVLIYTRKFTKPLIKMSEVTEKMSNMDFSQKCKSRSHDEIGILSESINNLSDSLDKTLTDLNEKSRRLSDDIEKKQTLEQLRKEFISSISHELKTPIAIIKGYAEGAQMMLEAGDSDGVREYCDVIVKESDKMNNLVHELLELSRYELGDSRLDIESFDLKSFIDDYTNTEKLVFEEYGITYTQDIKAGIICQGDFVKLSMVLNNYVSNAVVHASGKKSIHIFCEEFDRIVRVKVFNSGERINDEDIEKIWKSFYRADKSLSRKEGRYGLGLSIVSAIQNLHGTDYGVENTEDGVIFWFDIKKEIKQ